MDLIEMNLADGTSARWASPRPHHVDQVIGLITERLGAPEVRTNGPLTDPIIREDADVVAIERVDGTVLSWITTDLDASDAAAAWIESMLGQPDTVTG